MSTDPLSPAAQAVLDAFHLELPPDNQPGGLPAALRAAADQVGEWESAEELRAIAAELEANR